MGTACPGLESLRTEDVHKRNRTLKLYNYRIPTLHVIGLFLKISQLENRDGKKSSHIIGKKVHTFFLFHLQNASVINSCNS